MTSRRIERELQDLDKDDKSETILLFILSLFNPLWFMTSCSKNFSKVVRETAGIIELSGDPLSSF